MFIKFWHILFVRGRQLIINKLNFRPSGGVNHKGEVKELKACQSNCPSSTSDLSPPGHIFCDQENTKSPLSRPVVAVYECMCPWHIPLS